MLQLTQAHDEFHFVEGAVSVFIELCEHGAHLEETQSWSKVPTPRNTHAGCKVFVKGSGSTYNVTQGVFPMPLIVIGRERYA
jgi:hypothetical protein